MDASTDRGERHVRVLYLVTRSIFGGAQSHVFELLKAFRREFDVVLGTGCEGQLTERARAEAIPVNILPHLMSPAWPWSAAAAVAEVRRLIRTVQPDLVSTHSFKAGLAGRLAARQCSILSIHTAHGWPFSPGAPWARRRFALPMERLAANWCSTIITVSTADRELALRCHLASAAKLVTVHNGVRDGELRATPGSSGPPEAVMIARFEPQKDFGLLLHALHGLQGDFHMSLVGDGPTRERTERLSRRLGLEERVQFLGFRPDVAKILSRAHVFVLASRWEGLPLTVLEAMRAGLPVVASDVGGVDEAVVDGQTGFLVARGDVSGFQSRLERLLMDPGLRARMGAAGRARYLAHFTLEGMLQGTRAVYAGVLQKADTRG